MTEERLMTKRRTIWYALAELRNPSPEPFAMMSVDITTACDGGVENPELHERLIARQTDAELERKAEKAWMRRGKLWTQEEIDVGHRKAQRWSKLFHRHGQH